MPPDFRSLIICGWAAKPSRRPSVDQLVASLEMMRHARRELKVQAAQKRSAATSAAAAEAAVGSDEVGNSLSEVSDDQGASAEWGQEAAEGKGASRK